MWSLQSPDILWIHWRVYNSIANTSKGVLFLPSSYVYARSFLYLLYTLIKLYYTKALSVPASPLALDRILLLWRPRTLASLRDSATVFLTHTHTHTHTHTLHTHTLSLFLPFYAVVLPKKFLKRVGRQNQFKLS